jgi:hypothetical protein
MVTWTFIKRAAGWEALGLGLIFCVRACLPQITALGWQFQIFAVSGSLLVGVGVMLVAPWYWL